MITYCIISTYKLNTHHCSKYNIWSGFISTRFDRNSKIYNSTSYSGLYEYKQLDLSIVGL